MPANLPPEYFEVEKTLRTAKTPQEKITIYEKLISIIPKHKGTEKLLALYKSKIAKAKDDLQRRPSTAKHGPLHRVEKSGAGQVIAVGPPNSGKSSLIKVLTGTEPDVADYPFTTRTASPFMMPFENIQIQLVDMPPITPEYMESWFPELVKIADAVVLIADAGDPDSALLLDGIVKKLQERKVEFIPGGTAVPSEKFPFVKKTLLVLNKNDADGAEGNIEDIDILFETPLESVSVSANTGDGIEKLRRRIFELLDIVRVYSKIPGKKADMDTPFTLRNGSTVMDMARAVHKDFSLKLSYARVWNGSGLDGLRVNRDYVLLDEDVVELHL